MEYLIIFLVLVLAGALLFAKGLWDAKRMESWQRQKLKENFGKKADREYQDGEFERIPGYFEKHQEGFFLDDITWNDLNMDELFHQMNSACSSAGQEYLYYMLRSPSFSEEELMRREVLMQYFTVHEEERLRLLMLYGRMGRTGKYSIYDYLDFLDNLGERSSGRQILLDLLFLPAAALTAVIPQVGLPVIFCLLTVNIMTYMKEKRVIEPYLTSFKYVFRAISFAEQFCKEKIPVLEEERKELTALLKCFQKLKRSSVLGMRSMGDGGSPLDVVMDYLNMIFHFDILSFNRMLNQVREHKADIDALLTVAGRIDALIAAAGYRQSLPVRCTPEFLKAWDGGAGSNLCMKELYHPLLSDPVANDIDAKRGVLLTGSNASGKSTFLKAVAINAVFAQTIHACCCSEYRGCFFRTMSSMSLRDDLESGESYYIVEIKSIKRILDAANEPGAAVLCFVDEVLRGTNTVERIAASTQILRGLLQKRVCCFAATHDVELTQLLEKEYDNYHFEEEVSEGDISFPYKLMEGRATTRNAIRLLALMGYDEKLIGDAQEMAAHFVNSGSWM